MDCILFIYRYTFHTQACTIMCTCLCRFQSLDTGIRCGGLFNVIFFVLREQMDGDEQGHEVRGLLPWA